MALAASELTSGGSRVRVWYTHGENLRDILRPLKALRAAIIEGLCLSGGL